MSEKMTPQELFNLPEFESAEEIRKRVWATKPETRDWAIKFATKLIEIYPDAKTVEDVIDLAQEDGRFETNEEMLAVWGRLNRMLPNRAGNGEVK